MRLYWGSYAFDDNACIIASQSKIVRNSANQMYKRVVSHEVSGYLAGSGQAAITQAMNALMTALAKPYQNFVFKQDDGTNSATVLDNASSLSGVTITDGPNFKESIGAEYSTQRRYTFTAEAEYLITQNAPRYLRFSERLDFSGGGRRIVVKEAIVGFPQVQQVREHTTFYVVQTGMAEGATSIPPVPPPIWPGALLAAPEITYSSPDRVGNGYERFGVTWSYRFGSPTILVGFPHLWL